MLEKILGKLEHWNLRKTFYYLVLVFANVDFLLCYWNAICKIGNNLQISDLRVSLCYGEKFHHKRTKIVELRLR